MVCEAVLKCEVDDAGRKGRPVDFGGKAGGLEQSIFFGGLGGGGVGEEGVGGVSAFLRRGGLLGFMELSDPELLLLRGRSLGRGGSFGI